MNDHNIKPGSPKVKMPAGPIRQHKRLAAGDSVSGSEASPNGGQPSRENKVGNARVPY